MNPARAFPNPAFQVLAGVLLFALLCPVPVWCADDALLTRVAVAPLANESEDASGGIVGRAVTETIDLNLRLFGKYRVERPAGLEEVRDAASAAAVAEREHLDSVVLGSVKKGGDGSYLLTARLYDKSKGAFTISREARADTALDIFDAADELARGFLEAISGQHIGFGRIVLKNSGEKGSYSVSVDGAPAGENITEIPKVLNGAHVVAVAQKRMMGEWQAARQECFVREDGEVEIGFAIPLALEAETAAIDALLSEIRAGAADPLSFASALAIKRLEGMISSTPYSPGLAGRLKEARALEPLLTAYALRAAVEEEALSPKLSTLSALRGLASSLGADAESERLRPLIAETAAIQAELFDMEAAIASQGRDYPRVLYSYEYIEAGLDLLAPQEAAYYKRRIDKLKAAFEARRTGAIRVRGWAPWALGAGVALAAGGAALAVMGQDKKELKLADALYLDYQAASDPATAASLHDQIAQKYSTANTYSTAQWGGIVGGAGLAMIGLIGGRGGSPDRQFNTYLDSFFRSSLEGRNRLLAARKADGKGLVLISPDLWSRFSVNGKDRGPLPLALDPSREARKLDIKSRFSSRSFDLPPARKGMIAYVPIETGAFSQWMDLLDTKQKDPAWMPRR